MTKFDAQLLRLKQALKTTEDQAVATALGLTKSGLSARKARESFPVDRLRDLAASRPELGIDVHWVLTGESTQFMAALGVLREASVTYGRDTTTRDAVVEAAIPSPREAQLLEAYRGCSVDDQDVLYRMAQTMAESHRIRRSR